MSDSAAPRANGSAARAESLLASYARAGYARATPADPAAGRAVPRPVGRRHPQEPVSRLRSDGRRALPAARPHHSGRARLSRLAAGRPARGLLLSRPGVSLQRQRAGEFDAGRRRILRPRGHVRRRRRDARARARGDGGVRHQRRRNPHGRCRPVRGADRGARSGAGLEAAPGQGFQPQDLAGAGSRTPDARDVHDARRL